jgi:uncharacterized membrane protein YfcA
MSHLSIIGTILFSLIIPATIGSYTHFKNGNLKLNKSIYLIFGSIIGATIGSGMSLSIDEDILKYLFSAFLISMSIRNMVIARRLLSKINKSK